MTTSAQIFSDQLNSIKNTFSSLLSQYTPTFVNYQSDPTNTAFSNSYDSLNFQLNKCNTSLDTLNSQVNQSVQSTNSILSNLISQLDNSNNQIPTLFEKNMTSMDMKMDNIKLYNYQILLNWEMFLGMIFIFFCLIFYYRKFYNTKELIDYTKQKMSDISQDVSSNLKQAKEEMVKLTEPPSENIDDS
jgi:uncharacterized protein YukE